MYFLLSYFNTFILGRVKAKLPLKKETPDHDNVADFGYDGDISELVNGTMCDCPLGENLCNKKCEFRLCTYLKKFLMEKASKFQKDSQFVCLGYLPKNR